MTAGSMATRDPGNRVLGFVVLSLSVSLALVSAHRYAGGWNDGSRLATVECLVDYHTLAIDQSIFVQVPPSDASAAAPYPKDEPGLLRFGTGDKLLIQGHYYSDKSPVPALLMAGVYQVFQWCTGLSARDRPDLFCYWMTLFSSGLAYVIAVWCIYQLGGRSHLPCGLHLTLTASFALATVALPYLRHVNNHILLLGVTAALCLGFVGSMQNREIGPTPWPRLIALGSLVGFGYTIDLGVGPVLLVGAVLLIIYRCRHLGPVTVFVLAALPWLALHHAVNYAVGGTFKPANAVSEYFQWPGCSFNPQNMTGTWNHESVGHFLTYAAALLVGKRGFLGHNLPLFLLLPAFVMLLWRRVAEAPELLCAVFWCGGTWLAYALTSNNYSGQCCSVRWFVPLLAPAYYVLALFLRQWTQFQWIFLVLSGWGAVQAGIMWYFGPWMKHMIPLYWLFQGMVLLSLLSGWAWRRSYMSTSSETKAADHRRQTRAA
jgi:hypothetical protein